MEAETSTEQKVVARMLRMNTTLARRLDALTADLSTPIGATVLPTRPGGVTAPAVLRECVYRGILSLERELRERRG